MGANRLNGISFMNNFAFIPIPNSCQKSEQVEKCSTFSHKKSESKMNTANNLKIYSCQMGLDSRRGRMKWRSV
jgi:hypothetical protein